MKLIKSAPAIILILKTSITNEFINKSFWYRIHHVKSIISYIFQNENQSKWKTSYIYNMIKYTTFMKRDTTSDKQRAEGLKTKYSNKKPRQL